MLDPLKMGIRLPTICPRCGGLPQSTTGFIPVAHTVYCRCSDEPAKPDPLTLFVDGIVAAFAPVGFALRQICEVVETRYVEAGEPLGEGNALLWFIGLVEAEAKKKREEKASE